MRLYFLKERRDVSRTKDGHDTTSRHQINHLHVVGGSAPGMKTREGAMAEAEHG